MTGLWPPMNQNSAGNQRQGDIRARQAAAPFAGASEELSFLQKQDFSDKNIPLKGELSPKK